MVLTVKNPIFENLNPNPDGVNTQFYTSQKYERGTVSLWVNGIRKIKDWDDGFDDPGDTLIIMKEAPLLGDSLQGRYEPK